MQLTITLDSETVTTTDEETIYQVLQLLATVDANLPHILTGFRG